MLWELLSSEAAQASISHSQGSLPEGRKQPFKNLKIGFGLSLSDREGSRHVQVHLQNWNKTKQTIKAHPTPPPNPNKSGKCEKVYDLRELYMWLEVRVHSRGQMIGAQVISVAKVTLPRAV